MKPFKYKGIQVDNYYIDGNFIYFKTSSLSFVAGIQLLENHEASYIHERTFLIHFFISEMERDKKIKIKKLIKQKIKIILKKYEKEIKGGLWKFTLITAAKILI